MPRGWYLAYHVSHLYHEDIAANIDGTLKTMRTAIDRTLNALRADQNAMRKEVAKRSDAQTKWIIRVVVAAVIVLIGLPGWVST